MRKTASMLICALMMGILLVFSNSCKKEDPSDIPELTTAEVSGITQTAALSGGIITDDGGETITARGVCWSASQTPVISDNKTVDGNGTGNFTSNITGLDPSTTYFARAYATNSKGTGYGSELSFTTKQGAIDADGNIYQMVTIGTQTWMTENLRTTKYNDGADIPLVTIYAEWEAMTTPGYCWYENNEATYKANYGALYNWYTVNTGKLCPTGWHVPTDEEWTTLANYLGGLSVAGGRLKETGTAHWLSPNTGATNEFGFTALPGGGRADHGKFLYIGVAGYWWSSSEVNVDLAPASQMVLFDPAIGINELPKWLGFSVRCLRNN